MQSLRTFPLLILRTLADHDALIVPCSQPEVVGTSVRRGQGVQDVPQFLHLSRMALGDQHGFIHRLIVQGTAVHIHAELIQVQCLGLASLGLVDGHAVDVAHEQIDLGLQPDSGTPAPHGSPAGR